MKLTVSELYGLDESLTDLSSKELPINIALKIKRNLSKVAGELKPINDMRTELINKYKESVDGNLASIKKGSQREFNEKYSELMNQKIDIKLDEIKLSDLSNVQGITVKAATLTLLEPIVTDSDDD